MREIEAVRDTHGPDPVTRSDSLPDLSPLQRNLERHLGDPLGRPLRDHPGGLCDLSLSVLAILESLLLDVETLGVLTNDNKVDGLSWGTRDGGDGADVGVEVEVLAEGNDGGGVTLDLVGGG